MAYSVAVGTITEEAATGNKAYTGVGFQPKVLLFFGNHLTADGNAPDLNHFFGAAISSSSRRTRSGGADDAVGTSDTNRAHQNAKCIQIINPGTTTELSAADFVSMDADGFTINWTAVGASREVIAYVALGGSDLTNFALVTITAPAGTGSQAYTGVGFQPDCILIAGCAAGAMPTNANDQHTGQMGWGTATAQGACGISSENAQAASDTDSYQSTSKIIALPFNNAILSDASLTSLDADGFTLNFSTAGGSRIYWALALKGGSYKVGSILQKTSPGTQSYTGVGFMPKGLLLMSDNQTAGAGRVAHARYSLGAASGPTARASVWCGDVDGADPTEADSDLDTATVIKMMTAGTPTTEAEADLDSFDADGFTLDWVAADATAREILYLAFGDEQATAALTGTAVPSTENQIRAGGRTIIITLAGDAFVAAGAGFDAIRQDIIDGFVSAQSEPHGWNAERAHIPVSAVVRTSDTVVTLTLPALPDYEISASDILTGIIPAVAVVGGVAIVATPTITITPSSTGSTTVHPIADTLPGAWTNELGATTNLYASIDEEVIDDNDYVRSPIFTGAAFPVVFKLGPLVTPAFRTGHLLQIRHQFPDLAGTLTAQLRQGYVNEGAPGTLIREESLTGTTDFFTKQILLTPTEASLITDYEDLYVRLVAD